MLVVVVAVVVRIGSIMADKDKMAKYRTEIQQVSRLSRFPLPHFPTFFFPSVDVIAREGYKWFGVLTSSPTRWSDHCIRFLFGLRPAYASLQHSTCRFPACSLSLWFWNCCLSGYSHQAPPVGPFHALHISPRLHVSAPASIELAFTSVRSTVCWNLVDIRASVPKLSHKMPIAHTVLPT